MAKSKILIVAEKWTDCDPRQGKSAAQHNFVASLAATGLAEYSTFFFDEMAVNGHPDIDAALMTACQAYEPDLIFLKMVRGADLNPTAAGLAKIGQKFETKISSLYGDTFDEDAIQWIERYTPVVDFNIMQDCYSVYHQYAKDVSKYMDAWTPQDPATFFNNDGLRPIDVSFVGSVARYPDRKIGIGMLAYQDFNVVQRGGGAEADLAIDEYAQLLRQSKMTLNFSRPVFDEPSFQCKGRTIEATLCGAMLLEQTNLETRKWLEPGIDYVEFDNERDLSEKAAYYLAHEDERRIIATTGCRKATEMYSATAYWSMIIERMLG